MTVYEENIKALLNTNPLLATKIFAISGNERFEVFQGEDPTGINILDTQSELFLYDNPIKDVLALAEKNKAYNTYPYRYFYGIGNGIYLKMVLQSDSLKRVIVIEENLELLYIVFNLIDFTQELISKKLYLELAEDIDFPLAYAYLNNAESKLYARLFNIETPSNYYTVDDTMYNQVTKIFSEGFSHAVHGHGNCPIDSLEGIENHFLNLPDLIKAPKFNKLFKTAKNQTAVIVSTGPSLTKQIPLLKKIKDHVLIICVDASFPILEKHGIKPDYVTVLERVPETAKFFENNAPEFQKDVHFVCVSIIHEKVKNAIKTGNLILQMRPHGYTQYFELDDYGYIGGGMSAANLAQELAVMLEVKNLIYIGQDLAFGEDDTSHAADHTFTVNEENVEGHDLFVEKYGGEGKIRTTYYWNLFRVGIEQVTKRTSELMNSINSTEGGSRIHGTKELSFKDAIDQYVDMNFEKTPVALVYPTEEEINTNRQQVIDKTNFMFKDAAQRQEKIEALFMKTQEMSEKLVDLNALNKLDEIDFKEVDDLISEIDVIKSYLDDKKFVDMYMDTLQSQLYQLEVEFAPKHVLQTSTEIEKQAKDLDWLMKHRYWLFVVAGGFEAQREVMTKTVKTWPDEMQKEIIIPEKKEIEINQEKYELLKARSEEERTAAEKKMKETLDNAIDSIVK